MSVVFSVIQDTDLEAKFFPEKSARAVMDLTEYVEFLAPLSEGDAFEVKADANESPRALKRRLTIAGKTAGKRIQYSRRSDGDNTIVGRIAAPKSTTPTA